MIKMARTKKVTQKVPKIKLTVPTQKGDMVCRCHGLVLELQHRWNNEEDRYAGSFFRCPKYGECGYYVTGDGMLRSATDGNGIALGRLIVRKGRRRS